MYRYVLLLLLGIGFTACDHAVSEEQPVYAKAPVYDEQNTTAPASSGKFQRLFERSKLQYPDDEVVATYGGFENFKTEYFFLDSSENLTFIADKEGTGYILRNELHEGPTEAYWDVAGDIERVLEGEVYPYYSPTISNYTWLQIHATAPFSYPLLRIVLMHVQEGKVDHLWAVIMEDSTIEAERKWYDLGKRPERFFSFKVGVANNVMKIFIDGEEKLDKNVSYWQGFASYYKAGAYITKKDETGIATVQFKNLSYGE